jgi:uncharacterized protein
VRERIVALDVVRGVAVAGILFANVLVFFGEFTVPPAIAAARSTVRADDIAKFLEHVFVQGKFYSIFSLLFGIGFGVQLSRGDAAVARFRRRLKILLGIGAAHAVFVWAGDILMLYALLGFFLIKRANEPEDQLLRRSVRLLAIPPALYVIALAVWWILAATNVISTAPSAGGGGPPPQIAGMFERMGTGGIVDAFLGNLVLLTGRWAELFATVRFPKVLGMFVLGLWTVRTGLALAPHEWRSTLVRWRNLGWAIGLPANIVAAWADLHWEYLPPSGGGLLSVVMQAIGFPMLAIGYAATITLLVIDGRKAIGVFAPVGRMALTNYLTHSIVCVTLSYGFGFGLYWRIGAAGAMAIAAAIILLQIPLSAWWLSRHRFGPVEWVWRRLTYRTAPPS